MVCLGTCLCVCERERKRERKKEGKQDYMHKLLLSRSCRSSERKEKKTAVFVTQSVRMEGKCCVNITR